MPAFYDAGPTDLYNYQLRTNTPTDEMKRSVSPADMVDKDSSPMFIWHTSDDNVVPVKNAIDMAAKLAEAGKRFELHIYPKERNILLPMREPKPVGAFVLSTA